MKYAPAGKMLRVADYDMNRVIQITNDLRDTLELQESLDRQAGENGVPKD